jgi:hypothetical protein
MALTRDDSYGPFAPGMILYCIFVYNSLQMYAGSGLFMDSDCFIYLFMIFGRDPSELNSLGVSEKFIKLMCFFFVKNLKCCSKDLKYPCTRGIGPAIFVVSF